MYKNTQGKWLTKALFYELTLPDSRDYAIYTLKDEDLVVDGREYLSLKKCFLSCTDPTEFTFASKFLGGWSHWKELQTSKDVLSHIQEWREERDVSLQSQGVVKLIEMGLCEEASFQAAKYVAEKGWKEAHTKGRPTKAAVQKAAREEAALKTRIGNDLKRIRSGKA